MGGSDTNRVYSVIFSGYDSTELVSSDEIKPLEDKKHFKRGAAAEMMSEAEMEKERKRKKMEKKMETKTVKTQEQGARQQSWQKFAKKSAKKGVVIPGMTGKSHAFFLWDMAAEWWVARRGTALAGCVGICGVEADPVFWLRPAQARACSAARKTASPKPRSEWWAPARA